MPRLAVPCSLNQLRNNARIYRVVIVEGTEHHEAIVIGTILQPSVSGTMVIGERVMEGVVSVTLLGPKRCSAITGQYESPVDDFSGKSYSNISAETHSGKIGVEGG